ncbi:MAG: DUF4115 domain-containing protein [Alphaproteobacteria bacterium]|nr:DUF4115 domain-containing protein [Alphaproteobacteria bacterium]
MDEVTENITNKSILTAGEMLRDARTTGRRKREISTIAKQLCIREEFLQALEDGNYAFIPELVYVLGFARNYAIELGLDPTELIEKIKTEMGVVKSEISVAPGEIIPDGTTKHTSIKSVWQSVLLFSKQVWSFVKKHWKWFAIGFGALIVASVVLILVFGGRADNTIPQEPVEVTDTVVDLNYNIPVREYFGAENRDKAEVVLQAIEDSYVAVEDSRGRVVFGRSLVAGDVYFVPSGNYKAKFGNAGGIDVWVNGKLAPKIAKGHVAKSDISLLPKNLIKSADK